MDHREDRQLHDPIGFTGLRARATAIGLVQLTTELIHAGALDDGAIGRIKNAIRVDLSMSRRRSRARFDDEAVLCDRLDPLIPLRADPEDKRDWRSERE